MNENYKVNVPIGEKGIWRIEKFTVTPEDEKLEMLRSVFSSSSRGRFTPAGEYTRLMRGGAVVMSDTPDEINDIRVPIRRATGNILINGLGLGVLLNAVLMKSNVCHVTVIELSGDVIELVGTYYKKLYGNRLEIINADALKFRSNGSHYNLVWHDIWDNICEDNLPQMKTLHRKYGRKCDWQGSWCREYLTR